MLKTTCPKPMAEDSGVFNGALRRSRTEGQAGQLETVRNFGDREDSLADGRQRGKNWQSHQMGAIESQLLEKKQQSGPLPRMSTESLLATKCDAKNRQA